MSTPLYICTPPTVPLHLAPSCPRRQAVALAFDHAVLPASAPLAPGSETRIGAGSGHSQQQQQQHRGTPPRGGGYGGSGDSSSTGGGSGARFGDILGREAVALSLLMDLVAMCSGTGSGGGGGGGSGAATQQQLGPSSPSVSATSSSPLTRGASVRMSSGGGVGGGGSFLGASAPVVHYPGGGSVVGIVGGGGVNGGGLWMRCPTPPPRTFLLELLEGVLSQRYDVFRRLPQMTVALRQRVGGETVCWWGRLV